MSEFDYKKKWGQNFIKDNNIINKIVKNSGIDKNTIVIEIGPGAGVLSKEIIPLSKYAILYEIDERLKSGLHELLSENDNYEIIFDDFLNQDVSNIRKRFPNEKIYVVANLPYYITTPIIRKLMDELYPDKIMVMVQKEVAERLSAGPGNREYGMISVLLGSRYDIKKLFNVGRNCFYPIPNVDSAVVSLEKKNILKDTSVFNFEKLVKDAFQYKRKNLRNNLNGYDLDKINEILTKYGFDLSNRAEEIPISVFIEIAKKI